MTAAAQAAEPWATARMSAMKRSAPGIVDVFLLPGDYFVCDSGYRIHTLLGSCVSITLWHPMLRVGAMSHFLLSNRYCGAASAPDARYGEEAMWLMLRELERANVPLAECQAKIFGGGNMFGRSIQNNLPNVGQKNGQAAQSLLRSYGIRIVAESLFGDGHR